MGARVNNIIKRLLVLFGVELYNRFVRGELIIKRKCLFDL